MELRYPAYSTRADIRWCPISNDVKTYDLAAHLDFITLPATLVSSAVTPETDRHLKYSSSRFDPVLFGDSLIGVAVALLEHFEHHAAQPAAAAGNRAHHRIAPTTAAAPAY